MGGARFDFHGISGERGIVTKESDGNRAGERDREAGGGREERTDDGSHRESTKRTSPFRIPWYPGDTGRA